jgi:MOSC domain-containing protein YiiM
MGGPDKAVYAYPAARYAEWLADFPQHEARLVPGAFGENLTIDGLVEAGICAGDIHVIGSARLQVCQPRQPCFKFALRFEDNRMPRAMVRSGRSGWYSRVLEEGHLEAGDAVRLIARPNPGLAFETLVKVVYFGQASAEELVRIASAQGVARWLQVRAQQAVRGLRTAEA